jgi:hypothetical protein
MELFIITKKITATCFGSYRTICRLHTIVRRDKNITFIRVIFCRSWTAQLTLWHYTVHVFDLFFCIYAYNFAQTDEGLIWVGLRSCNWSFSDKRVVFSGSVLISVQLEREDTNRFECQMLRASSHRPTESYEDVSLLKVIFVRKLVPAKRGQNHV